MSEVDKIMEYYVKGYHHGFSQGLNWAAQDAKVLAATDSQQLKQAIALLKRWRTIYGPCEPDKTVWSDTDTFLAQQACV